MKRTVLLAGGAAASIALVSLSPAVASAGGAPDESGKKFSQAQADLQKAGYKVVVGTVVGDRLAQADCIVVNVQKEAAPTIGTKKYQTTAKNVVLSLNCFGPASATSPGFSAGDPNAPKSG